MGRFHGEPLKDAVYAPSWASRERVDYTLALAEVMADLVRSTASIREVSISTSPLAWRGWGGEGRERIEGAAHLAEVARALRALAANTGIVVRLGLEPEPGCVLDRTVDAAAFLGGLVRERLDGDESAFRHLGVCYDVCHQAVMHEDVRDGLDLLEAEGIPVVKAQATCAIEAPDPRDAEARRALTAFDEPVYLHQVGAKRASGDVLLVEELGDALRDDAPIRALAPWRIHFHVPVFRRALVGGLRSTRPHLDALLALVAERDVTRHIEIETYTFDVIPGIEKQGGSGFDLVDALEREYRTVLDVLSRHGVRATDEEASA
jgi:hypothetical protein